MAKTNEYARERFGGSLHTVEAVGWFDYDGWRVTVRRVSDGQYENIPLDAFSANWRPADAPDLPQHLEDDAPDEYDELLELRTWIDPMAHAQVVAEVEDLKRERDEARAEAEKWRSELYFQRGAGDVAAGDRFPWDEEE